MKHSYKKPGMIVYGRDEIMEMLGPVKTQYVDPECLSCKSLQVMPEAVLMGKQEPLLVSVDTSGCTAFQKVQISIPGSSPFIFYEFSRADGADAADQWSVILNDFQFLGDRGVYDVVVTLIDAKGAQSTPCQTTLTIE